MPNSPPTARYATARSKLAPSPRCGRSWTFESVKKTSRLVCVYEAVKTLGIGAEVSAMIAESEAFDYLDAPVTRVSGKDVPMPYAANLEKLALPSVAEVVEAAKAVCYR